MSYRISERKIIIYGAGSYGVRLYNTIKGFYNINLYAFADVRANEMGLVDDKYQVLKMEDLIDLSNKNDYVIVISVKNVFEHDAIASRMRSVGFSNIIYRAGRYLAGNGNETEIVLSKVLDLMYDGDISFADIDIPSVEFVRIPQIKDCSIISEDEDNYTVLLPTPLVFTDDKKGTKASVWRNINIYALFPHIYFFRFLLGMEGNVDDYLEWCCESAKKSGVKQTDNWKKNVLRNRSNVFSNMERAFNFDSDFFIRNAVNAVYNDNNYFNLCSGKHRATYIIAKGKKCIPLGIKKQEYTNFLNLHAVEDIKIYLQKEGIYKLDAPIEHPYFANYPCDNEHIFYKLLEYSTLELVKSKIKQGGTIDFAQCSVGVCGNDLGFIKRAYRRMGCRVFSNKMESDMEKKLNTLFYMDNAMNEKVSTKYDVLFICGLGENLSIDADCYSKVLYTFGDATEMIDDIQYQSMTRIFGSSYYNMPIEVYRYEDVYINSKVEK